MYDPWRMIRETATQLMTVRRERGVGLRRQFIEFTTFRRLGRISRAEFYRYKLWRPDAPLSAKVRFTSYRERVATEMLLNPAPHRALLESKTRGTERLRAAGIPVPEPLAVAGPASAAFALPKMSSLALFRVLLAAAPDEGIVLKPDDGMCGKQVIVAPSASAEGLVTIDGALHPAETVWREIEETHRTAGWRMERRIAPHPDVAAFAPGATPTVRVLTLLVGGETIVHAATLKIPRGQSGVDNFANHGNLAAPIDVVTGRVGRAVNFANTVAADVHPDSRVAIAGLTVPHWEAVRAIALRGAEALAPLRALGWDIALGREGPVVLEANESWGQDIVQVPQDEGVLRGRFLDALREAGADFILRGRDAEAPGWRDSLPLPPSRS